MLKIVPGRTQFFVLGSSPLVMKMSVAPCCPQGALCFRPEIRKNTLQVLGTFLEILCSPLAARKAEQHSPQGHQRNLPLGKGHRMLRRDALGQKWRNQWLPGRCEDLKESHTKEDLWAAGCNLLTCRTPWVRAKGTGAGMHARSCLQVLCSQLEMDRCSGRLPVRSDEGAWDFPVGAAGAQMLFLPRCDAGEGMRWRRRIWDRPRKTLAISVVPWPPQPLMKSFFRLENTDLLLSPNTGWLLWSQLHTSTTITISTPGLRCSSHNHSLVVLKSIKILIPEDLWTLC